MDSAGASGLLPRRSDAPQDCARDCRAIHSLRYFHAGDALPIGIRQGVLVQPQDDRFRPVDPSDGMVCVVEPSPNFHRQWVELCEVRR